MGGEEDALGVLRLQIGVVQGDGLLLIHVDTDASDLPFVDCADKVGFHGDAAAAGVDEEGCRFHLAKPFIVDEPCRPFVVGRMDADDVGLFQEFLQGNAGKVLAVPGAGGGVVDDLHPESRADGGDLLSDGAHAHDSEGFPRDLRKGMVRIDVDASRAVAAVPRIRIIMERPAGEVEDVHPGSLGDGIRGIAGDVPDDNAPLVAQLRVDVVDAGPRLADEPHFRTGIQKGLVDNHFVQENDIGIRRADAGFFRRGGRVAGEFAQRGDFGHGGIAHRGGVQKNDYHIRIVMRTNLEYYLYI